MTFDKDKILNISPKHFIKWILESWVIVIFSFFVSILAIYFFPKTWHTSINIYLPVSIDSVQESNKLLISMVNQEIANQSELKKFEYIHKKATQEIITLNIYLKDKSTCSEISNSFTKDIKDYINAIVSDINNAKKETRNEFFNQLKEFKNIYININIKTAIL